jgi:hypothetical protein
VSRPCAACVVDASFSDGHHFLLRSFDLRTVDDLFSRRVLATGAARAGSVEKTSLVVAEVTISRSPVDVRAVASL